MELFITLCIAVLLIYSVSITWGAWNTIKKNEQLESALEDTYGQVSTILQLMRSVDNKQMFESDDEVGTVFTNITDLVYSLETILGESVDGNTKNES